MDFIKTESSQKNFQNLRTKLYQRLTAPMDAMWEQLYIASSQAYFIQMDHLVLGYFCVDDRAVLLQFYLEETYLSKTHEIIEKLIHQELIKSARLSSKESIVFNTCLLHSKSIKANTLCFEHNNKPIPIDETLKLEGVSIKDIPSVKEFFKDQIGLDDSFGYTENLVARKEIYLVRESGSIIATSECRMSDSQVEIADLGIIVHKDQQGKGIASQLMQMQVNRVLKANRKPICSTTIDNLASQKAIERAGFYCSNIIFGITF